MKRRELIKKLESIGFELYRNGGNHDIYKRGADNEVIPRHKEINEFNENLAKAIWGNGDYKIPKTYNENRIIQEQEEIRWKKCIQLFLHNQIMIY